MARPKKRRKASDVPISKTYYLRFAVTRDVEREAEIRSCSASKVVEELLVDGLARRQAERAAA